jgi:hypothetical protein
MIVFLSLSAFVKQEEPWRPDQLMEPANLSAIINNANTPQPLIISIGPSGLIKNAVNIGPASKKENLDNLKKLLLKEKKDRQIIIYCGCCPFQNCPNIRPAFKLLNEMKFTNQKLLNLTHNLKVDWIDHGYAMQEKN